MLKTLQHTPEHCKWKPMNNATKLCTPIVCLVSKVFTSISSKVGIHFHPKRAKTLRRNFHDITFDFPQLYFSITVGSLIITWWHGWWWWALGASRVHANAEGSLRTSCAGSRISTEWHPHSIITAKTNGTPKSAIRREKSMFSGKLPLNGGNGNDLSAHLSRARVFPIWK